MEVVVEWNNGTVVDKVQVGQMRFKFCISINIWWSESFSKLLWRLIFASNEYEN